MMKTKADVDSKSHPRPLHFNEGGKEKTATSAAFFLNADLATSAARSPQNKCL